MKNRYLLILFLSANSLAGCTTETETRDTISNNAVMHPEYILSSTDSVPEGVTYDPLENAFYVGGYGNGSITRINAEDGEESSFMSATAGIAQAGIKINAEERLLWACVGINENGPDEIWIFNLDDRSIIAKYPLATAYQEARCNDLVLDQNGSAYVTDSFHPNIYRVDSRQGTVTLFSTHSLFEPSIGGINGIVLVEDNSSLLIGKYDTGELLKLSMSDPNQVSTVMLDQPLIGPDGLVLIDGVLYSISDSKVQQIIFDDASYTSGTVSTSSMIVSGLSTGTEAAGHLYAVKSETTDYILAKIAGIEPALDLPFKIVEIDLASF